MPRQFDFISSTDFQKILDQQPTFKCPVCKAAVLSEGEGGLLCSACEGNAFKGNDYAFGLSETVVKMIAPLPDQKELAGFARVQMHWQMRMHPVLFKSPISGAPPSSIRDYFAQYVAENIFDTTFHCGSCDEMIRDSDPDDPLVCPVCGSKEVEARNLILAQIVHLANLRSRRTE